MSDLLDDIVPAAANAPATSQRIALVAFPVEDLEKLGFIMQLSPELAIIELLHERIAASSPNGHGNFTHVCAGCGREFTSNRRQLPGKRMWCGRAECKKEAAALRARDYRDRRTKETT